jgi:hypothetical protein
VDRCQACRRAADCTAWLGRTAEAEVLPGFCPNKAALESLRTP